MDTTGRVAQAQDGWYLVCGDERRGPYRDRPTLALADSLPVSPGFAGSDGTRITRHLEQWEVDGARVSLVREVTETIDAEPQSKAYFLEPGPA